MNKPILIADSGSTKTDWCLIDSEQRTDHFSGSGLNPFFMDEAEIVRELRNTVIPHLNDAPEAVYFYGAGCTPEKAPLVAGAIGQALSVDLRTMSPERISVNTDMLGAARALCGRNAGVACILGTGSNSCLYDGERITANVPPLGFIVGDEGSGAVLGKLFIGDLLKGLLTPGLREAFLESRQLTMADVIERVYRRPLPNRFLASLSPFIAEHRNDPTVRRLVMYNFRAFLTRNVMQYLTPDSTASHSALPIHFVGSIAYVYRDELEESAGELGLRLGKIMRAPIIGLVEYHTVGG